MAGTTTAVIVAGGRGSRMGPGEPKQYRDLNGDMLIRHTLLAFARHPGIDAVLTVIHADDRAAFDAASAGIPRLLAPVIGGPTRQASVRAGLEALAADASDDDIVLIHDAARPFVSDALISRTLTAMADAYGALPALPVVDTLRREDGPGLAGDTTSRDGLWRAQTPQTFRFGAILKAHRAAATSDLTDDVAVARAAGIRTVLVPGDEDNLKITTQADLERANAMLQGLSETRTGMGFDVHRFTEGSEVILCGVPIPHTHMLEGHSDADAGLHALTDALLGAIGEGDIGQHFPPSDPQWKGAPSDLFLRHAADLARAKGATISNLDLTIICERPKIGPHREAMCLRVAEILDVDPARVSVKATTTEALGFTGRREGLAAQAVVSVRLPYRP